MRKLFKYKFSFAILGIIACILLMVSRQLGARTDSSIQALNHVLVVTVLFICIFAVFRIAAVKEKRILNDKFLLFLLFMPFFNLSLTALQLILGDARIFSSAVFTAFSVLLSLPSFFCLFFAYITKNFSDNKVQKICCYVLWGAGGLYTVLRLFDKTVFPVLSNAGMDVKEELIAFAGVSSVLSVAVYVLSVICFLVFLVSQANKTD